jgi:hypothetical protein
VLVGLAVLSGFAVASSVAGDPVDRNGIPTDPDAMGRTLQQAAGASIVGVCRVESEAWPPALPTEAEINAASKAGGKSLINGRFVLGSARDAANTLDVEIGWADGDGASFWAVKASQKYPTVVRVDEVVVGAHQLWRIASWVEFGACDGELVPST